MVSCFLLWTSSCGLQVKRLVLAIRKGLIKPRKDEEEEEKSVYPLWGDDSNSTEKDGSHLSYIPAPKPKLPGM